MNNTDKRTNWWRDKSGRKNYDNNLFDKEFLNCLGNLVISKIGANSGKGTAKPEEKEWSTFLTQVEIGNLIAINTRRRINGPYKWLKDHPFNIDTIYKRQEAIVTFAQEYWSYKYCNEGRDSLNIIERDPLI